MRIISKEKDYIDGMQAYGQDENLVWVRKSEIIQTNIPFLSRFDSDGFAVKPIVIGFCGELLPMILVDGTSDDEYLSGLSYSEVRSNSKFAHLDGKKLAFYSLPSFLKSEVNVFVGKWNRQKLTAFFTEYNRRDDSLFVKYKTPVFAMETGKWTQGRGIQASIKTNIILKDYGFQRVKDPFTAYQAIATYLGNQLVEEKSPDEIADKYRIAQHGFDEKSFRHPTRLSKLK